MNITVNNQQIFPIGTTVKAYLASNWGGGVAPSGAPKGSVASEATVAADGSIAFTGLTEKTLYYATAEVGGVYRYVSITPRRAGRALEGIEINSLDFGVYADGVTDNYSALMRAIAAGEAQSGEGSFKLLLPPGIILVKTMPEINKPGCWVEGVGWDQSNVGAGSVIKAGAAMAACLKGGASASTLHVAGVSFNQAGAAEAGLKLEGLNCQIEHCGFRQPKTGGFAMLDNSGESLWALNLRLNGANQAEGVGIRQNGTDGIIIGCKPVNVQCGMELLGNASGTQILGGHVTPGSTIGKQCVFLNGNANRVSIDNLRIDNHKNGAAVQISPTANIRTIGISNLTAFQNLVENEVSPVIGVDTTSANVYGLNITGCKIESAASHLYKSFIDAVKANLEAATNKERIKTQGTLCEGNTFYGKSFYGSLAVEGERPLVGAGRNAFSENGTAWSAV